MDYKGVYKIIHGELKQPFGVLDEMNVMEVVWMLEANLDSKKDYFEMVSYSVKTAMASVYQGKDIRMFDENNQEEQKITKEQREEELAYLTNKFGEL